ncbi:hypothetical protein QQS21_012197 [Conoideocrella luteorostrata]|uniref:Uncharacterized protein n=1 Tax=Conoideocrella luteorostrata TaxID=1105319 RepID=A0AAJ0FSN5_9HYPO|nr:hypothetical protein QQS21_012197 [Conoideocrella luteorostrata]
MHSAQWSDLTDIIRKPAPEHATRRNKLQGNPFSDPVHENEEVIQLQDFGCWGSSLSPPTEGFVSEHPSWEPCHKKRNLVSRYLKPSVHDEDEDDATRSNGEVVDTDRDMLSTPKARGQRFNEISQTATQKHDTLYSQRRITDVPWPSYALPTPQSATTGALRVGDSSCPRASSVYEDEFDDHDSCQHANTQDVRRNASKRRPATLGFDRNARGHLVTSYSKSSSHASADLFRFDGDGYSPFLKPTAEREVSKALYCHDSTVGASPSAKAFEVKASAHTPLTKATARFQTGSPTTEQHPLSELDTLVKRSSAKQDNDGDWQTVTTEQAAPRALELTLRLERDVGSSLADVSDVTEYESFDQFVGANTELGQRGNLRHFTHHGSNARYSTKSSAPWSMSPGSIRQSFQKHHRRQARAAAAIRRLSSHLSPDAKPKLSNLTEVRRPILSYSSLDSDPDRDGFGTAAPSPTCTPFSVEPRPNRADHWPVSTHRLDSQEILGHGSLRDENRCKSRDFAAHQSTLTETSLPRFPFPLISLPEAAALQCRRRERGEEDHTDPGPMFAAKARSCTISTISTNGPKTPGTPLADLSDMLAKPKQVHHRREPTQTLPLEPTPGQLRSSGILYHDDRNSSFFHSSIPNSASLISARFFRLSGFSARTRERRANRAASAQQRCNDLGLFTPSQTDLIRSAREDILFRRRHNLDEDKPQRLIFLTIMVLTIFFPLIGVLALYGKFDGTISWYARGEKACLTTEQRGKLKQQIIAETIVYPALIISLSVYYSIHK